MSQFKCIASETMDVPVGTILIGKMVSNYTFLVVADSKLVTNTEYTKPIPKFKRGERLPLEGGLWIWEEIKDL